MAQAIPLRVFSTPFFSVFDESGAFATAAKRSAVAVVIACSPFPHPNPVISTEGGAFAAAVEKSAVGPFPI
jgi:hypothetical protein